MRVERRRVVGGRILSDARVDSEDRWERNETEAGWRRGAPGGEGPDGLGGGSGEPREFGMWWVGREGM